MEKSPSGRLSILVVTLLFFTSTVSSPLTRSADSRMKRNGVHYALGVSFENKPSRPDTHYPHLSIRSASMPTKECQKERDRMFNISWPMTGVDKQINLPCPSSFSGNITRHCRSRGCWSEPMFVNCRATSKEDLDSVADRFFTNGGQDMENVKHFIRQLRNLTFPPPMSRNNNYSRNEPFLNRDDLRTINAVTRSTIRLANISLEPSDVFGLFNNALETRNRDSWKDLQQSESGSEELLNNAESYASIIALNLEEQRYARYSGENIVLRAERPQAFNATLSDIYFPNVDDLVNSSAVNSSIKIPSVYLKAVAGDDSLTVAFILLHTLQDFLPFEENTTVVSVILSAQVISNSLKSAEKSVLTENPIELNFSVNATIDLMNVARCVYWNFSTDFNATSTGGWVSEGIETEIIDNSTVRCLSHHLTSFAVLVDLVGTSSGSNDTNPKDKIHSVILSWISYIGCGISIVCLVGTITYLLLLRKFLLTEVSNFIHLNLSISLLLGLIVFICGIQYAANYEAACRLVALLLHYFFLSVFCWMFCEAMMLYLLVVVVFSKLVNKWYLYLVIGWGTPLIIVAITFGVFFSDYVGDSGICWLNYSNYVIWSFTGPMCIIILVNLIVLTAVAIQLFRAQNKLNKIMRMGQEENTKTRNIHETKILVLKLIKGIIILLPILGITWLIGIFALDEKTIIFAWFFTILNSLQGAFIFLFYVMLSRKFRNGFKSWYAKRKKIHGSTISTSQKNTIASFVAASSQGPVNLTMASNPVHFKVNGDVM